MKLLIKEINIKSLVSNDKQARITLETLEPGDIRELAKLAEEMEIEVIFDPNAHGPAGVGLAERAVYLDNDRGVPFELTFSADVAP